MNRLLPDRAVAAGLAMAAAALLAACAARPPAAPAHPPLTQPPQQFPLRDFFRNPDKGYFRISGDGRWIGFMQPAVGEGGGPPRRNVFVQPLAGTQPGGEARQLTRESARDIGNFRFKGGDTVLYEKDFGGDENFHVVAVDVASGRITDLTPHEGTRAQILDELREDPQHILVAHNRRNKQAFDAYRINVRTGAEALVAENPGNIVDWVADHAGRVRVAVASDGVNTTVLYRAAETEAFKPLFTTDFRTEVLPAFFHADDRRFYAVSNRGRDRKAAVLIDPQRPAEEELIYEHPRVDLDGLAQSHRRKLLIAAGYQVERPGRHYFDARTRAMFEDLERRLPGYEVTLQSVDLAENRFIVAAISDRTPGRRYVYDADARSLTLLGEIAPWLPEAQMAPVQPISYKARDGLEIPGYLTLPPGRPTKNLACIVNPHGGPWTRDGWGYNPEVQFLANRGWCVLQMNFRGSTGYGRKFWEASFGQWGLKMQDDVTDGVHWLVSQGIADPKRIGIYGASYGGYVTLAGVTFTPGLYAAAVDYVGVSNLLTFMNTIPPYWEPYRQQMYAMVGDPGKDLERLRATSPVFHAERIRTPLLIAQGAKDPRVNKAESDQIVAALRQRGVDVQYIVKDNEGHGFANEENKFEFYAAMEAFFRRHMAP